jgi:ATP-dependent DNA ligase
MSLRPRALPVGFIAPCLPKRAPQPPSGAIWLHEIKWDGFRVIARKEGERVRLYSRPGHQRGLVRLWLLQRGQAWGCRSVMGRQWR